ncbi:hypothetical protein PHLH8_23460 [Pseudomonas sp. Pc102]|uniref:hypothetical protein n=1 Tax=Pseudomonas sp. Pc102 TaxID=2678261 RepID=UPI001BD1064C|nr:hypothetical protein [Pseudomonas sp. Pc102]BBP82704.1 hypothetical protein PHLH8_23460 [Pseudomonas sp. Pc102]
MRAELLQVMLAIAESRRPASELGAWFAENSSEVEAAFGRATYLRISQRGFKGLGQALEQLEIEFHRSDIHCQACGEPQFVALPGKTTREEIIEFARRCKLKGARELEESGWIHPGQYCPNGCTLMLYSLSSVRESFRRYWDALH